MGSNVTNRQIFFLLFLTLTTYAIINTPKIMAQKAGSGAWLPLIAISVVFAFFAVLIAKLGFMFPGKAFFVYSHEIVVISLPTLF